MKPKTAKIIATVLKVFIFIAGTLIYALLKELRIGALWVVMVMAGILWCLFYKWEDLWVKNKIK